MAVSIVLFVAATLAASLLAGLNLGSLLARKASGTLPGEVWICTHQAEDAVFSRVMPPFLLGTIALSVAAAIVALGSARWLYAAAAVLILIDLVVTVARLVPLNRAIAGWSPGAPPPEWRQTRSAWSRLHTVRTVPVLAAALLSVLALAAR